MRYFFSRPIGDNMLLVVCLYLINLVKICINKVQIQRRRCCIHALSMCVRHIMPPNHKAMNASAPCA
jgi:hypothetical protein